jgi:3-phenylpropionate/trans-cinnamate dioxygenase ferredoxin reductase subunit
MHQAASFPTEFFAALLQSKWEAEMAVEYKYLIIGGGMAGDAALEALRKADPNGSVGVIGRERNLPYNRPPLSKGLWKGDPLESVWRKTDTEGAEFHLGRQVLSLDARAKRVTDDQGRDYGYQKLLLATGGTPRRLASRDGRTIYYRTLDDYKRLRNLAESGRRFAVIGGGFIGWEIAAALAMNGREVVMIFPGKAIGSHIYPADLATFLSEFYSQKGVQVLAGESVAVVEAHDEHTLVKTQSGKEFVVDGVAAGLGIEPNVALAQTAGLQLENGGVAVDEYLRTSNPDVYAAGDVASFFNPALGKRIRVEHEDNANTMGRLVGENMAAAVQYHQPRSYDSLPFFYSDLFELGYEAVGDLDPRLETIADWKEPYREGAVYYIKEGRVRGVLLWNIFGQVDAARSLIAEPGPFRATDLKGRIPGG